MRLRYYDSGLFLPFFLVPVQQLEKKLHVADFHTGQRIHAGANGCNSGHAVVEMCGNIEKVQGFMKECYSLDHAEVIYLIEGTAQDHQLSPQYLYSKSTIGGLTA